MNANTTTGTAPCVWITRPEPGCSETSHSLQREGYRTHLLPLLNIQQIELPFDVYKQIDNNSYKIIVITSEHAIPARKTLPHSLKIPLAVTGEATAAKARNLGLDPAVIADGNMASLAAQLISRLPPASRVLYLRGRHIQEDLKAMLYPHEILVDEIVVYEAVASTSLPAELIEKMRGGAIHATLAYSRRSLKTLEHLLHQYALEDAASRLHLVCLSSAIARAAGFGLWQGVHFSEIPSEDAVLDVFKRLYGAPPRITT